MSRTATAVLGFLAGAAVMRFLDQERSNDTLDSFDQADRYAQECLNDDHEIVPAADMDPRQVFALREWARHTYAAREDLAKKCRTNRRRPHSLIDGIHPETPSAEVQQR